MSRLGSELRALTLSGQCFHPLFPSKFCWVTGSLFLISVFLLSTARSPLGPHDSDRPQGGSLRFLHLVACLASIRNGNLLFFVN